MTEPVVSIIIPLYNEEKGFEALILRVNAVKSKQTFPVEVVLVDDGSSDATPELMKNLALQDAAYHCIFLSRNHGHQLALTTGMKFAKGTKAVMVMDGDLQDPPELLDKFYEKIEGGYDVVYAIRKKRKESWFKKISYWAFYRIQRAVTEFDIPLDSGDFSMMSRRVVDEINAMPEQSRFIRGLRSWVGFKQTGLEYEREGRYAGDTKYSLKKLFNLAYDGIINFSDVPLKLITRLGFYTILVSLVYISIVIFKKLFYGNIPEGFTTIIIAIALFSGVQLISLGIIGEYLARIYTQVKQRPISIVKERIQNKQLVVKQMTTNTD